MSRRGQLLFVFMGVIWGIPYLLIKVAVRELSAPTLVFARTAPAALLLLPLAWRRGYLRPAARPLAGGAGLHRHRGGGAVVPAVDRREAAVQLGLGLLIAAVPLIGAGPGPGRRPRGKAGPPAAARVSWWAWPAWRCWSASTCTGPIWWRLGRRP